MSSTEGSWFDATDSHAQFHAWEKEVRDPAELASEGVRRLVCRGAEAEYEIAPLPDGRYAMHYSLGYRCGNFWNRSSPWCVFETREACIETFLADAHRHFGLADDAGKRSGSMNASMTMTQQIARAAMQELLARSDLFGFLEPSR